jgi:hypothetical protein
MWWKANEAQFLAIEYLLCQTLNIVGNQIEMTWLFSTIGILTRFFRWWPWDQNSNKLVLISKNWPNDLHIGYKEFAIETLYDFGDYDLSIYWYRWKSNLKINLILFWWCHDKSWFLDVHYVWQFRKR